MSVDTGKELPSIIETRVRTSLFMLKLYGAQPIPGRTHISRG